MNQEDVEAWLELADIYVSKQNFTKALFCYEEMLIIMPKNYLINLRYAETLYSSDFYANMHKALRPGGVVCTQGECQFLHADLIAKVMGDARALYPVVDYAFSTVPTYPSGQIGYIIAQKSNGSTPSNLRVPSRSVPRELQAKLRYYNSAIHSAAFVLPAFMANKLASLRNPQTLGGSSSGFELSTAVIATICTAIGVAIGFVASKRR
jgi:tetratricopeptide (TPR) repeat protein